MMANKRCYSNDLILAGGPVNLERGFILHTATVQSFENSYKVTDDVYLTTSADVIESSALVTPHKKYLVALGCASWSADQLEKKLQIMIG